MGASQLLVAVLLLLASSTSVHAYLDPGTGSILLQGLLASVAAGIGIARLYWQRLKMFFSSGAVTSTDDSQIHSNAEAQSPDSNHS